jgi:hypothetical protein
MNCFDVTLARPPTNNKIRGIGTLLENCHPYHKYIKLDFDGVLADSFDVFF